MIIPARLPRIGRRRVLAAAGSLFASPSVVRAQGQSAGVALVIGNSKYKWEASLPNVRRDAPDVAQRFQALGLRTELLQDAGQEPMRAAVARFAAQARGANFAAFYFAGHGASWDKDTYLVPGDADLGDPSTVPSLLSVRAVAVATKEAQHRLLVFDSCRNNPADGWRQRAALASSRVTGAQLAAAVLQGPNTLVLFSTAPGRVAVDGPAGENSPFAATLLRRLAQPSVELQALPSSLRRDLLIATEGRQVVWDQSTYRQPFLLTNTGARDAVAKVAASLTTSLQPVELPNAYAFAREKSLLLPPGLIGLRAPNGSPESQKVGSFKTADKVAVGTSSQTYTFEPFLLVVLCLSDAGTAEIIYSTKDWAGSGGNIWRYATAQLSGPKLEFLIAGNNNPKQFRWTDANSGTFADFGHNIYLRHNTPFTRLD
jgi:hypothetical protein